MKCKKSIRSLLFVPNVLLIKDLIVSDAMNINVNIKVDKFQYSYPENSEKKRANKKENAVESFSHLFRDYDEIQ